MSLVSLKAVFDIETPQAGVDLWPDVFAWLRFVALFCEFLGGLDIDISPELDLRMDFLTFNRKTFNGPGNEVMVISAAGFAILAVRTWACLLARNVSRLEDGLYDGLPLISIANDFAADDVIEGAGGSMDNFAALIIGHLGLVVLDADTELSVDGLRLAKYLLEIWARMDGIQQCIDLVYRSGLHLAAPAKWHSCAPYSTTISKKPERRTENS
ncbi:hypothetical protein B0H13DRAFT_2343951 [Mycena leptocephala]|jgi:hypothetical protein|nr:hypothetical protein B0H13DRAFT_1921768 [Mycena leptocephala]KAJ7883777.1 hypothetical protein B0H13DRAFT_2343951 [Mycena leptocephala]